MYADLSDPRFAEFAHGAAAAAGISVEDEWWPDVLGYLTLLLTRTDLVSAAQVG